MAESSTLLKLDEQLDIFRALLSPDQKLKFEQLREERGIDFIQTFIKELDETKTSEPTFCFGQKVEPFLKQFLNLTSSASPLAAKDPHSAAPMVLAAVQTTVRIAIEYATYYEKTVSMLNRWSKRIQVITSYDKLYSNDDLVRARIDDLRVVLVKFSICVVKALRLGGGESKALKRWRRLANPLFKGFSGDCERFNTEFEQAITAIMECVNRANTALLQIQREATLDIQSLAFSTGRRQDQILEILEQQKEMVATQKRRKEEQKLLDRLSSYNWRSDFVKNRNGILNTAGRWIINSDEFKAFCSSDNDVLLVTGELGFGKTILCTKMIQTLLSFAETAVEETKHRVLYFFAGTGDKRSCNVGQIIACLARQCLPERDLPETWKDRLRRIPQDAPTHADLEELFADLVADDSLANWTVIIDGLDQLQVQEIKLLVKTLNRARENSSRFRILLVNREESGHVIRRYLTRDAGEILQIRMIRSEVHSDICDYTRAFVDDSEISGKEGPELLEEIITKVPGNANGLFLLAKYQLLAIEAAYNTAQRRRALRHPPKDIFDCYIDILDRITQDGHEHLVSRAFKIMSAAQRLLSCEELYDAVAVRYNPSTKVHSLKEMEEILDIEQFIPAFRSLVTLDDDAEPNTVDFLHSSLKLLLYGQAGNFRSIEQGTLFQLDRVGDSAYLGGIVSTYLLYKNLPATERTIQVLPSNYPILSREFQQTVSKTLAEPTPLAGIQMTSQSMTKIVYRASKAVDWTKKQLKSNSPKDRFPPRKIQMAFYEYCKQHWIEDVRNPSSWVTPRKYDSFPGIKLLLNSTRSDLHQSELAKGWWSISATDTGTISLEEGQFISHHGHISLLLHLLGARKVSFTGPLSISIMTFSEYRGGSVDFYHLCRTFPEEIAWSLERIWTLPVVSGSPILRQFVIQSAIPYCDFSSLDRSRKFLWSLLRRRREKAFFEADASGKCPLQSAIAIASERSDFETVAELIADCSRAVALAEIPVQLNLARRAYDEAIGMLPDIIDGSIQNFDSCMAAACHSSLLTLQELMRGMSFDVEGTYMLINCALSVRADVYDFDNGRPIPQEGVSRDMIEHHFNKLLPRVNPPVDLADHEQNILSVLQFLHKAEVGGNREEYTESIAKCYINAIGTRSKLVVDFVNQVNIEYLPRADYELHSDRERRSGAMVDISNARHRAEVFADQLHEELKRGRIVGNDPLAQDTIVNLVNESTLIGEELLIHLVDDSQHALLKVLAERSSLIRKIRGYSETGQSVLFSAINAGNLFMVRLMLDQGVSPNCRGDQHRTAMESVLDAPNDRRVQIFEELLKHGFDHSKPVFACWSVSDGYPDNGRNTLLGKEVCHQHRMAKLSWLSVMVLSGELDCVKLLLALGASVNGHSDEPRAPVVHASRAFGFNPLHRGVEDHSQPVAIPVDILQALLVAGPAVSPGRLTPIQDIAREELRSVLCAAISHRRYEQAVLLFHQGWRLHSLGNGKSDEEEKMLLSEALIDPAANRILLLLLHSHIFRPIISSDYLFPEREADLMLVTKAMERIGVELNRSEDEIQVTPLAEWIALVGIPILGYTLFVGNPDTNFCPPLDYQSAMGLRTCQTLLSLNEYDGSFWKKQTMILEDRARTQAYRWVREAERSSEVSAQGTAMADAVVAEARADLGFVRTFEHIANRVANNQA